ncbi:MAG: hypothetical protein PHP95_11010 [Desulfuromonadaceae bacterium]|nr:hypothetical protein [Desulfuromonadaceae bacterium]MDD2848975.1 hypothetical protein [Desulfuromonadaceae bacterium]MDD4130324.1 hypothetical protein [Desulfuromonadaceae bacterium]
MGSQIKWIFILMMFVFLSPTYSHAAISLPWSSTYNCSDWLTYSGTLSCDGFEKSQSTNVGGHYEEITSAANYSGGAGGKGQRHWVGDGQNVNTGGTKLTFATPQKEIWIRWYIRYQSGFKWSFLGYDKILYFNDDPASGNIVGLEYNGLRSYSGGTGVLHNVSTGGWDAMYPSGVSDGSWHCMEVHLKSDATNGVVQYWVDGSLKLNATGGVSGGYPITSFTLRSNQNSPNNGGVYYTDVDDISINNTGYIGPIGGGSAVVPKLVAPTNLKVK